MVLGMRLRVSHMPSCTLEPLKCLSNPLFGFQDKYPLLLWISLVLRAKNVLELRYLGLVLLPSLGGHTKFSTMSTPMPPHPSLSWLKLCHNGVFRVGECGLCIVEGMVGRDWEYLGCNSSLLLGPHELQSDRVTMTLCQPDTGHILQDGAGRRL